jgi:phosphatidylserine synthase
VAPAGLVFSALSQNPLYTDHTVNTVVLGLSCGIYVLCAALRLGRFNVEATLGGNDVYFGLPMPMAGGFLVSGLLVLMKYAPKRFVYHRWAGDYPVLGSFSSPDVLFFFFWVHVLLVAYLMVSSLKVPKPKKTGTITGDVYLIGNMVITYIVIPFRVFPEYLWFVALQYLLISIYYAFFTKRSKRHHKRAFLDVLAMPPLDEKD